MGITTEPVTGIPLLHSTPLPDWAQSGGIGPIGTSDPAGTWRETKKVLKAIARAAALFGPL